MLIKFTIPLDPKTKKNSQTIAINTKTGKPFIRQSDTYREYENDCMKLITGVYRKNINFPVNIKAVYYRQKKNKVDITNLHSALHDILVKVGVIADDNINIVVSTDGSRVYFDKNNPRTEIEITEAQNDRRRICE